MSLSRYGNQGASSSGCGRGCDSESAEALKKILDRLDDLNENDLRLLAKIIDRILCKYD